MLSYKQKNLSRWWYILCYNQRPAVLKNMGAIPCAAMLAATTNGHWAPRYVAKTFMCCSYSHNFPQLFPAKKAKRHLQNNINDFISSHPHPDILWYSIWHPFCILSGILSDRCSDILSGILFGILSNIKLDILLGILSGIYSDILSGIVSGILFAMCSGPGLAHWPTASGAGRKTGVIRRGAREESRRKERGSCTFVRPSPGRWGTKVDLVSDVQLQNHAQTANAVHHSCKRENSPVLLFFFECSTFMQVRVPSDF